MKATHFRGQILLDTQIILSRRPQVVGCVSVMANGSNLEIGTLAVQPDLQGLDSNETLWLEVLPEKQLEIPYFHTVTCRKYPFFNFFIV